MNALHGSQHGHQLVAHAKLQTSIQSRCRAKPFAIWLALSDMSHADVGCRQQAMQTCEPDEATANTGVKCLSQEWRQSQRIFPDSDALFALKL